MSKAALSSLTKGAAAELGPKKIRVNAVAPGTVRTNALAGMGMTDAQQDAFEKHVAALTPAGRVGLPSDITPAVLFFADGTQSGWVSGAELIIDGGLLTRSPIA
jgi:3-oxoacyl-[acyl-carrier protein] reductase